MAVSPRNAVLRVAREESGISLIEVMMTAAILVVVLGAILSLSDTTAKIAPNDDERALLMQETRTGLQTMSREVRHATAVTALSDYSLTFSIQTRSITYACNTPQPGVTGRVRCTRQEGTGPTTTVLNHVRNPANNVPVFVRNGASMNMTVQVAAAGDRREGHSHTITLSGGAYMRNLP